MLRKCSHAAAAKYANTGWLHLAIGGIAWYFAGWWALVPIALAAFSACQFVSASIVATALRQNRGR